MKRAYIPPLLLLTVMTALCLWNSGRIQRETERWQAQLEQVDELCGRQQWPEALAALEDSRPISISSQNTVCWTRRRPCITGRLPLPGSGKQRNSGQKYNISATS